MRSIIKMPSDEMPPSGERGQNQEEEGQCEALLKCLPTKCRRAKRGGKTKRRKANAKHY